MMFFWFLFLIPLVFWMMRSDTGERHGSMNRAGYSYPPAVGGPDPLDIVRQRLARGEITTSEYEVIRRALG